MGEAYIIDAVRTPRGIGKQGKGALAAMHPQHLAATVAGLKLRKRQNAFQLPTHLCGAEGRMIKVFRIQHVDWQTSLGDLPQL